MVSNPFKAPFIIPSFIEGSKLKSSNENHLSTSDLTSPLCALEMTPRDCAILICLGSSFSFFEKRPSA